MVSETRQAAQAKKVPELILRVRAGFVAQGSSLKAWCDHAGVDHGYARNVLAGGRNGPAAHALVERIKAAAGCSDHLGGSECEP